MSVAWQKHKNSILQFVGLIAVSLIVLPYFLLGEGSYVQIHDQMDGEILNYIYQAKYLFRGDIIPEFMNGMSKAAMLPPAPFGVLFYRIFSPFTAFVMMQWFVLIAGFLGMYTLCRRMKCCPEVGMLTAICFCYMPFYPVYGLAALGQPMLVCCFLELLEGQKCKHIVKPLLGILLYAFFSSLTLIGYAWILLGAGCTLYCMISPKRRKKAGRAALGTAVLTVAYLLTNLDLLKSLFAGDFETHRSEMVVSGVRFTERVKELLFQGGSYSKVYSSALLLVLGLIFIGGIVYGKRPGKKQDLREVKKVWSRLLGLAALTVAGVLLAALWTCSAVVAVRNFLGGPFLYFQADRIYWIFPFLWMLILADEAELLYRLAGYSGKRIGRYAVMISCLLLFAVEGAQIFRDGTLNKNFRLLLVDGYEQVTWESIYMEETFSQIDALVGEDKDNVSVVSLGLYPSIPLYNGYTCADGYSNNYDLAYKHSFREIQARELEKSEEVRIYFDEWGNRLYLASSEYGYDMMIGKGSGIVYHALSYDMEAMRRLNIGYIFAAAPIDNAASLGLELLEGSPFAAESSYYEIWVYRIPPEQ